MKSNPDCMRDVLTYIYHNLDERNGSAWPTSQRVAPATPVMSLSAPSTR